MALFTYEILILTKFFSKFHFSNAHFFSLSLRSLALLSLVSKCVESVACFLLPISLFYFYCCTFNTLQNILPWQNTYNVNSKEIIKINLDNIISIICYFINFSLTFTVFNVIIQVYMEEIIKVILCIFQKNTRFRKLILSQCQRRGPWGHIPRTISYGTSC